MTTMSYHLRWPLHHTSPFDLNQAVTTSSSVGEIAFPMRCANRYRTSTAARHRHRSTPSEDHCEETSVKSNSAGRPSKIEGVGARELGSLAPDLFEISRPCIRRR